MQTFLEFKTRLRAEAWPAGEARSMRGSHDAYFNAAMLDIQKWVPCVRQHNVSTWEGTETKWENAKTVVNAPWGKIRRVYTVAGGLDRWRDKVRYRSSTYPIIECWANALYEAVTPTNTDLPALQLGFRHADVSQNSVAGRARIGIWAIDRKRLYIAPYIQTTEMLVVDWDGIKSKWLDSDGVDETYWTTDYEDAVKLYVLWKHLQFHTEDKAAARAMKMDYDSALADLIYSCREYTMQQHDHTCDGAAGGSELVGLTDDTTDDDDDPTTDPSEDEVLFNAVGDLGDPVPNAALVADAIESDNPEAFLALGDLSYNGDYADDFGVNYQWAIDAGIVVPVIGNHDFSDHGNSFDEYKAYFADFVSNDGEHYEKVVGSCHFLIYNTEDTGNIDIDSEQAEWLRLKLLLSPARWKVVLMHRSPFSSDTTHPSDPDLQLPFADWTADAVISAHSHLYERHESDGIPYFVVGTGGRPLYAFGAPIAQSVFRDATHYGRLIGQADCFTMVLSFKGVDGVVYDTLTLTKE